ncbi:PREDICTED: TMV resistance protein N-like [Camelina sativa]|uniref:TMV resistance protein N-like n=1 Tax=Camelina sativa TaxID=90675 RepID=A0ABM0VYW2_CAMSA|nr:PREDICTED: TMV resistance protein N-like [Camelina sativa]
MASSSSSRYGVFLSFRGTDTRRTFVSHLHKALVNRGIVTFKDDSKIRTGDPFPHEILEAIQDSTFAVIVISENFTSSKWCLIELQSIMELWSSKKLIVFPIFYGVELSDVRKEEGHFWEPLKLHMCNNSFAEEVPKWKEALTKVSYLNGKDSTKFKDDAAMIDNIVSDIWTRLSSMLPIEFADVVGMTPHMERLDFLLNIRSEKEVRMIGIWGMGGIGKTTISKYLFHQYSGGFSARCFIQDVWKISSSFGLVGLQEKFVSSILPEEHVKLSTLEHGHHHIKSRLGHQRVFVVLDGVDNVDQIRALVKESSMFGRVSYIIITTRDQSLLKTCGIIDRDLYEVSCLESSDSLLLLKRFAFEGGTPPSDIYEQLSLRASQLAHGLPFALEAFGLCFRGKTTPIEWKDELRRLGTTPHESTIQILKISYDDL